MRRVLAVATAAAGTVWMWRNMSRTPPSVKPPGQKKGMDTRVLEAGAALLQGRSLLQSMNLYLDGFHFYADDMGHQMEAHHFCSQVNEDFTQCVIFDGNTRNARLIGIEYILSERLFRTLPEEEKRLWHSHHYEVRSGTLIAPGIPERIERKLMEKIVSTYGTVWHTRDTVNSDLPMGIPALMVGFTADGQMRPGFEEDRDRRFKVSGSRIRDLRKGIPIPDLVPGANAWESGRTSQLSLKEMEIRPPPG
jgi:hypothetical protein